jgi:exodeoxyribonuclease VII large subunit
VLQASRSLKRQAPAPATLGTDVRRLANTMQRTMAGRATSAATALDATGSRLAVLDPMATLARGFAIVQDAGTRKVIAGTKQAKPGKRIAVSVSDGAFWAEVS